MYDGGTSQSPRSTCLYCEQRGQVVTLIRFAHWGICPVCNPAWAASIQAPDPQKGMPRRPGPLRTTPV